MRRKAVTALVGGDGIVGSNGQRRQQRAHQRIAFAVIDAPFSGRTAGGGDIPADVTKGGQGLQLGRRFGRAEQVVNQRAVDGGIPEAVADRAAHLVITSQSSHQGGEEVAVDVLWGEETGP